MTVITMSIFAAPAQARGCDERKARSAQASLSAMAGAVTCLLNQQRRGADLRRLSVSRRLQAAALPHARDMRDRDYFSHTSLDGRSFSQRIREAGYMHGRESGPWKVGETLAWATGGLSSPAQLVASLMDSPPHRAVILDGAYREVGVGLVRGTPTSDPSGVTLVVDFGVLSFPRGDTAPPPAPSPPASHPAAPEDEGRDRHDDHDGDRGRDRGRDDERDDERDDRRDDEHDD